MTLKLHLSCILISVSGLWIADTLAARWPFWWAGCPLRDLWVSEEDTWNPKWKGSEEGGIPPLLHPLPKSSLPFHWNQHLSYLFICLPFQNYSSRHRTFWNRFLFFLLSQKHPWTHSLLQVNSTTTSRVARGKEVVLLLVEQNKDKATENVRGFGQLQQYGVQTKQHCYSRRQVSPLVL